MFSFLEFDLVFSPSKTTVDYEKKNFMNTLRVTYNTYIYNVI